MLKLYMYIINMKNIRNYMLYKDGFGIVVESSDKSFRLYWKFNNKGKYFQVESSRESSVKKIEDWIEYLITNKKIIGDNYVIHN